MLGFLDDGKSYYRWLCWSVGMSVGQSVFKIFGKTPNRKFWQIIWHRLQEEEEEEKEDVELQVEEEKEEHEGEEEEKEVISVIYKVELQYRMLFNYIRSLWHTHACC